jgi:hypothetical protein
MAADSRGRLQREGEVTHVVTARCYDLSGLLLGLTAAKKEGPLTQPLSRAEERESEVSPSRDRKRTRCCRWRCSLAGGILNSQQGFILYKLYTEVDNKLLE